MAGASRTLTIKFVGDSKNANRAVKDLVSSMDETESAGKRVAAAMGILADDAETAFRDAKDAADKLATALGEETVAEIKAAGRSVEGYVQDLQRIGLSYDDIRTDVDELADSIRKVETTASAMDVAKTKTVDMGDEAKLAAGKVDMIRDSGDQSRSVLANMVGNSAQDLGALGGVAGTAGMAIGQLAEYATEGNIKLSNLAKIAGPMAAVSLAVIGVSWAMKSLQEESERAKREAELMLGVQEKIRDGKFDDAGADLAESYGALVEELEALGVPQDEVMQALIGTSEEMPTLNRLIDEQKAKLEAQGEQLEIVGGHMWDLRDQVSDARMAFRDQADQLAKTDAATVEFTEALIGAAREAGNTKIEVKDLEAAYKELTGELSNEEAWLNATESMIQFRTDMESGELSVLEQKQALVDVKGSLVDYLTSLEGVPAEKQTEILALIDQGAVEEASRQLDILARSRGVQVYIAGGGGLGLGVRPRAAGGPVSASGVYAVGDNPDGSWNATTELFVPSTSGNILSASDSRAALGGGGGTVVVVNVAGSVIAEADLGRTVYEQLQRLGRRNGGLVFS
jgi:hypothetical protein